MPIEAMKDVFHNLLTATVPTVDAPLRKWAEEEWRKAMESAVVDITRMVELAAAK